jgi:Holliday junction resolvasome RuvABC endonuclease subunit
MNILALDMATKTGWAIDHTTELSGVEEFKVTRGCSPGTRFLQATKWFIDTIKNNNIDLVVYELAHHRGGAATEVAIGLAACIQQVCAYLQIEHYAIHTSEIKKFATGKGNAAKEDMMTQCAAKLNIIPIDDNHADALWILAWARNYFATLPDVKIEHKVIPA